MEIKLEENQAAIVFKKKEIDLILHKKRNFIAVEKYLEPYIDSVKRLEELKSQGILF